MGTKFVFDRQYHEDAALRLFHGCTDKLTPTGKLKKHADPARFAAQLNESIQKLKELKQNYPIHAATYDRWIADAEKLLPLCTPV